MANDAHDNAQADREVLVKVNTGLAISIFRDVEQAQLRLDEARYKLERALREPHDSEHYSERTDAIRTEFEERRARRTREGRLPR